MSYYSPQSRNGAYLPHAVTFATFAEGAPIEGKLSDWRKEYEELLQKSTRTRGDKDVLKRNADASWQQYKAEVERIRPEGWYAWNEVKDLTGIPIYKLKQWFYSCHLKKSRQSEARRSSTFIRMDEALEVAKEMNYQVTIKENQ